MEAILLRKSPLPAILLAGGLLTACSVDKNYDLDEIDLTIGIGSENGLQIPASSTDTIKLSDVLDLEGTDCVVIADNGDYVFTQDGGEIDPTTVFIDQTLVGQHSNTSKNLSFTVTGANTGNDLEISVAGNVDEFAYKGETAEEIEELEKVGLSGAEVNLTLHFSDGLHTLVDVIDKLVISLPSYMTLSNIVTNEAYTANGSQLTFTNVPTSYDMTLTADITEIDLTVEADEFGKIIIDKEANTVEFDGCVHVELDAVATDNFTGTDTYTLSSTLKISDFYIVSATGRFNPGINLDDLGDVEISGLPDFLTDGSVVLDLYNPQIILNIDSDLPMGTYVGGTLTSIKDGATIATVTVPSVKVVLGSNGTTTTSVCICRRSEGVTGYDVVNVVPDICDLIKTIPDRITFSADVTADNTSSYEINLGQNYEMQPSYSISAPFAFGEDACIVYTDTVDGWNGDLEDIDLAEGAYLEIKADIENRIPAYLNVEVNAIDVNGEIINDINVDVNNTVIASADGSVSATTPLTITLTEAADGAMKYLDGLAYTVSADASNGAESVVGQTLNAEHFLIAKNISIMLVGRVIADLN